MEDKRPYLISDLSLSQLASKMEISTKILSQVINQNAEQNFYDFINFYRINEAKKFLELEEDKTILEILYECGFNSKSVFNNAFKKQTGTTPTKYKERVNPLSKNKIAK